MKWYPIYTLNKETQEYPVFFLPHSHTGNDENNNYLERKGLFNFEIEYHKIVSKVGGDAIASTTLVLKM